MSEQDEVEHAAERKRSARFGLALKALKHQTAEREEDWVEVVIPWFLTETARTEYARRKFPNGQTREDYVEWLNERVKNHVQGMLLDWFDQHVEAELFDIEDDEYLASAGLTQE